MTVFSEALGFVLVYAVARRRTGASVPTPVAVRLGVLLLLAFAAALVTAPLDLVVHGAASSAPSRSGRRSRSGRSRAARFGSCCAARRRSAPSDDLQRAAMRSVAANARSKIAFHMYSSRIAAAFCASCRRRLSSPISRWSASA